MGLPMRISSLPERNQSGFAGAQLAEADEGYGQDGDAGLIGEQADAGAEGVELSVAAAGALGKDQDGGSAIHCFAGVGEALRKPRRRGSGKTLNSAVTSQ